MDERLKNIIDDSKSIVFFGGAGVSTESGIPDFRSEKGLYSAQKQYGFCLLYTSAIKMIKKRATSAFLIMINSGGKVDL